VVLAGWVSLWVFWAFGVMDREEFNVGVGSDDDDDGL